MRAVGPHVPGKRRRYVWVVGVGVAAAVSCAIYDSSLLTGGGPDAGPVEAGEAGDMCPHAFPPGARPPTIRPAPPTSSSWSR